MCYHRFLFLDFPDAQHRGRVPGRRSRRPSPFDLRLRLAAGRQVSRGRRLRVSVGEHLLEPEADAVRRLQTFLEQ